MQVMQMRSDPDPYYDLDGAAAKRERTERVRRRTLWRAVLGLSAMLLLLMLARLPQIDASSLVRGNGQALLLASLAVDAFACLLIFAKTRRNPLSRL